MRTRITKQRREQVAPGYELEEAGVTSKKFSVDS
jgi:hypothetical protein